MKSNHQIRKASEVISEQFLKKHGMTEYQRATLLGMNIALRWILGEGGWLLEELVRGREARELLNTPEVSTSGSIEDGRSASAR